MFFVDRRTRSRLARDNAADRRIRRQIRHQARTEKQAQRDASRKATRASLKASVRAFWAQLPARLILIPVALAAASAWRGQFDWAHDPASATAAAASHVIMGLGWSVAWSAGLATALETLGLSLGAMARAARNDDDSAIVERTLMWTVVTSAAWLNWQHSRQPVLGLMSIAGVAGWEVYERRRYRHKVASDRPARRPRFGSARWVRFPLWTFRAWSVSIRDRIGAADASVALDRVAAEHLHRSLRRSLLGRHHKTWPTDIQSLVSVASPAAISAATETTGQATDTVLRSRPTSENTLGRHATETTGQPAEETAEISPSAAAGRRPGGDRQQATETTDEAADGRNVRPLFGGRHGRRGDRTRDREQATETTETITIDVDDLLPVALEVAAELGDRLSRDALVDSLRSRGLSVGGRRRAAIYRRVRDHLTGTDQ